MVCLGNICRSPLAEGILKSKLDTNSFLVDSAGTAAYHIGEKPDPRSIEVAHKNAINISGQRARQFKVSDFDSFDHIYVMDRSNHYNVMQLARDESDKQKVRLILEESVNPLTLEVPDPYYGGPQGFDHVFTLLDDACDQIASRLTQ